MLLFILLWSLLGFRCCDKDTITKMKVGQRGFIWLKVLSQSTTDGSQGRNLRREPGGGAEADSTEEGCFLACSPWLAEPVFFTAQDHRVGGPSHHNHHSQRCPQACLWASLTKVVPSFKMPLACVRIIKKLCSQAYSIIACRLSQLSFPSQYTPTLEPSPRLRGPSHTNNIF